MSDSVIDPNGSRQKAYEHIAAELRRRILSGELALEQRLPKETELADEFGVSRATIRESLRLLAAQDLIRTAKGARGGSFVTVPRIHDISQHVESSLDVLTATERLSLDELLEARKILEIPAAGLAAQRRREIDVERMRATLPEPGTPMGREIPLHEHRHFHGAVTDACGNPLVQIACEPIFQVLMTHFDPPPRGPRFHRAVNLQHIEIADAIERGDRAAAERLMEEHLDFMRPYYERMWRPGRD